MPSKNVFCPSKPQNLARGLDNSVHKHLQLASANLTCILREQRHEISAESIWKPTPFVLWKTFSVNDISNNVHAM